MTAPRARVLAGEALFLAVTVTAAVDVVQIRRARTFVWSDVTPHALASGTALTPYQYRALTGWIARVTSDSRCAEALSCSVESAYRRIDLVSVALLVYAFRAHLTGLLTDERTPRDRARLAAAIAAPLVVMALPWSFMLNAWRHPTQRVIWFPWDLPAVLGFTVCLWLLRAERWRWYYPAFALATLNKETTCALVPVYVLARWGTTPRQTLMLHAGAQALLWFTLTRGLHALYARNPGLGGFEDHLADNLLFLSKPSNIAFVLGSFGFAWAPVAALGRHIRDRFARRALWIIPAWALGMVFVGNLTEVRVFGELLAVVLPAWVLLARDLLRERDA